VTADSDDPESADADAAVPGGDGPAANEDDPAPAEEPPPDDTATGPDTGPMPIVGIGASAGGVDALRQFFSHLPKDDGDERGMAFVVVLHLAPDMESNLDSILRHDTALTVTKATDGTAVEAGHVYVIPPGRRLEIAGGRLRVTETEGRHEISTIDRFFRTLAADQGANAVGIVLSGSGTDGSVGLRAVKEEGGVTMVQDPKEAEYDNMPQSALASGLVDLVLPAEELAEKLTEYRDSAGVVQLPATVESLDEDGRSTLQKIFSRLYTETGHDFSSYKRSTILRRLERRLQINSLPSLEDYLRRLREDEAELKTLYRDLLISVTSFLRDPDAFAALEETVIPKLFEDKSAGDSVRVWVPGCATGEEAYSLAMLLSEHADTLDHPPDYQVFATDVDEEALQVAREGLYPEPIKTDVPEDRLQRYFEQEGDYYRVAHRLREHLLFAKHNLLTDPPFSDLDLVSCRNLLIYLDQEMQEHVFQLIHYALNDGKYLFLGRSEASGRATHLFSAVDKSNNILQARVLPAEKRQQIPLSTGLWRGLDLGRSSDTGGDLPTAMDADRERPAVDELHRAAVMDEVASVLVDENQEIVHLSEAAGRYLTMKGGAPSHKLLNFLPEALRPELRSALYQVFEKETPVERTGLKAEIQGELRSLDVTARPIESPAPKQYVLVRFEEREVDERPSAEPESASAREAELREELERTREQLQTTTEEYEAATEEMEAANEELLSMNEELQSKNEELETSKEELQSLNEELKTTNQELKTKIEEVRETNSVLENLMAATEIATLFLDRDLRIQRYTPRVTELFSIRPVDVGRPLSDFTQRFDYEAILDDAETVLEELTTLEREIHQGDDRWFLLRLRPYRTVEDEIQGVVLTFVDITARKQAEEGRRRTEARLDAFVRATSDIIYRVSPDWSEMYHLEGREVLADTEEPRPTWVDDYIPDDERARVMAAIEEAIEQKAPFHLEHRVVQADGSQGWVESRAVPMLDADEEIVEWFGTATAIAAPEDTE
jgi:two-component system CheB/CheR fusion protein